MKGTMRKIALYAAGMSALALILLAQSAMANEDWQYSSSWSASHALSEKAGISFLAEMYARDDMSDDYVYDEYVGYSYVLCHGLSALAQGYFESVEGAAGIWDGTRALVIAPVYKTAIPRLGTVQAQARFFWKATDGGEWDYCRPRVDMTRSAGSWSLYLLDEMRVDLSGRRAEDFYRNRVFAMVSRQLAKSFSLGVGYVRQSDRGQGDWESFNVLQTLVHWKF